MLTTLLVVAIVLLVLSMAVLAVGVFLLARGIGRLSSDIGGFVRETQSELVPALRELRQVLSEADYLAVEVREKIQRIGGVISHVENIVDGRAIATVASKAITGSKVTVASLLEGIKQGIRAFRGAGEKKREETRNEPE